MSLLPPLPKCLHPLQLPTTPTKVTTRVHFAFLEFVFAGPLAVVALLSPIAPWLSILPFTAGPIAVGHASRPRVCSTLRSALTSPLPNRPPLLLPTLLSQLPLRPTSSRTTPVIVRRQPLPTGPCPCRTSALLWLTPPVNPTPSFECRRQMTLIALHHRQRNVSTGLINPLRRRFTVALF